MKKMYAVVYQHPGAGPSNLPKIGCFGVFEKKKNADAVLKRLMDGAVADYRVVETTVEEPKTELAAEKKKPALTKETYDDRFEAVFAEADHFRKRLLGRIPELKEIVKEAKKLHAEADRNFFEENGSVSPEGKRVEKLENRQEKLARLFEDDPVAEYRGLVNLLRGRFKNWKRS